MLEQTLEFYFDIPVYIFMYFLLFFSFLLINFIIKSEHQ